MLNTIITFIINLLTLELINTDTKIIRLISGSAIGGIASLIILFPEVHFAIALLSKFLINILIIAITLGKNKLNIFIKAFICFNLVTIIFGGVVYLITSNNKNSFIITNNGYIYFNTDPFGLILTIIITYLAILVIYKKLNKKDINDLTYDVEIYFNSKVIRIKALFDTGNGIKDCYTGNPVIIVSISEMYTLLDEETITSIKNIFHGNIINQNCVNLRLLPIKTLGDEKLLPSFTADKAIISNRNYKKFVSTPTISVTDETFDSEKFRSLINKSVLGDYLI